MVRLRVCVCRRQFSKFDFFCVFIETREDFPPDLFLQGLYLLPYPIPGTGTAVDIFVCSHRSEASCVSRFDFLGGRWADNILDGDTSPPLSQLGRQFLPLPARCRARADRFERKSYPAQRRASCHTRISTYEVVRTMRALCCD